MLIKKKEKSQSLPLNSKECKKVMLSGKSTPRASILEETTSTNKKSTSKAPKYQEYNKQIVKSVKNENTYRTETEPFLMEDTKGFNNLSESKNDCINSEHILRERIKKNLIIAPFSFLDKNTKESQEFKENGSSKINENKILFRAKRNNNNLNNEENIFSTLPDNRPNIFKRKSNSINICKKDFIISKDKIKDKEINNNNKNDNNIISPVIFGYERYNKDNRNVFKFENINSVNINNNFGNCVRNPNQNALKTALKTEPTSDAGGKKINHTSAVLKKRNKKEMCINNSNKGQATGYQKNLELNLNISNKRENNPPPKGCTKRSLSNTRTKANLNSNIIINNNGKVKTNRVVKSHTTEKTNIKKKSVFKLKKTEDEKLDDKKENNEFSNSFINELNIIMTEVDEKKKGTNKETNNNKEKEIFKVESNENEKNNFCQQQIMLEKKNIITNTGLFGDGLRPGTSYGDVNARMFSLNLKKNLAKSKQKETLPLIEGK